MDVISSSCNCLVFEKKKNASENHGKIESEWNALSRERNWYEKKKLEWHFFYDEIYCLLLYVFYVDLVDKFDNKTVDDEAQNRVKVESRDNLMKRLTEKWCFC